MSDMWEKFGFTDNPYNAKPLQATADDLRLFQNRKREGAKFLTQMDSKDGCIVVVSGDAGIGKTSFVNIQQHILATGKAGFGPKLLPDLKDNTNNGRRESDSARAAACAEHSLEYSKLLLNA